MSKFRYLLMFFLVSSLVACSQGQTSESNITQPITRSITTTGDAEVKVAPDEVIITLAVETSNTILSTATLSNDEIVQRILSVTQEYEIDSKYVQTEYLNIEPRYSDYADVKSFRGYWVRKTIVITLKDLTKFEDFLSAALEAGANYVYGIQFRTTELRKYRDAARALAIQAAQEKAQALAGEVDQDIGQPLNISEQQSDWFSWYSGWWGYGYSGSMSQNVIQNTGGGTFSTEDAIAPGQISVRAKVMVEFELK